jgi:hypothetical protein
MVVNLNTAPGKECFFVPESVGTESIMKTHVVLPDNPISVMFDLDQEAS